MRKEKFHIIYLYLDGKLVLETDSEEQGGLFRLGEQVDILGIRVKVVEQKRNPIKNVIEYYLEKV